MKSGRRLCLAGKRVGQRYAVKSLATTCLGLCAWLVSACATLPLPGASDKAQGANNLGEASRDTVTVNAASNSSDPVLPESALQEQTGLREFANLIDADRSTHADVFSEFMTVDERAVVFPRDSAFVGQGSREVVALIASGFNADRDIVYVLGCSNGADADGLSAPQMALQRSINIKEALVQYGVPASRIYQEGCWSADLVDLRFPERAAFMTLKRLKEGRLSPTWPALQ